MTQTTSAHTMTPAAETLQTKDEASIDVAKRVHPQKPEQEAEGKRARRDAQREASRVDGHRGVGELGPVHELR